MTWKPQRRDRKHQSRVYAKVKAWFDAAPLPEHQLVEAAAENHLIRGLYSRTMENLNTRVRFIERLKTDVKALPPTARELCAARCPEVEELLRRIERQPYR